MPASPAAQFPIRLSIIVPVLDEAAGIAAALAVQKRADVRDLDPGDVRNIVLERGARLDV